MADPTSNFDDDLSNFESNLSKSLGDVIRKPISAILGFKDENGTVNVKVPDSDASQPSTYYFTQSGGQSFMGQAYLRDGVIAEWQLKYGTPIRVKKDVLNDTIWEIIGLDLIYANEFFRGVDSENVDIIPIERIGPGLLTSVQPGSMKAQVLEGYYDIGDTAIWIPTQQTIDWSVAPNITHMPDTGKARFVLVEINPTTKLLNYKYGDIVPASLTFQNAYQQQEWATTEVVLPQKTSGYFRAGYIKLIGGQTIIDRRSIWSNQQILGSSINPQTLLSSILSAIVTDGDDVVTDGEDVVWVE